MPHLPRPAWLACLCLLAACAPPVPAGAPPALVKRFVLGLTTEPVTATATAEPTPTEGPRRGRGAVRPAPSPSPTPAPTPSRPPGGSGGGGARAGGFRPAAVPSPTPALAPVTLGLTLEEGGFEAPAASEAAVVEEVAP
ncbi:MAG: hypothetical protein VKQ33_08765 [Candidatus Sericytochromatia bacterium]|nr:hypothetical protein [Candidatus Sericytochromatia bacterium]